MAEGKNGGRREHPDAVRGMPLTSIYTCTGIDIN